MSKRGKALQLMQGFFHPPNENRPDQVYLEDRVLNVDVYGENESEPALIVRKLAQADNAPTTLFEVLKNGTIRVAGVVATFFSGSHADLTNVTANQHHAQAHALDGADHTGTLSDAQIPASIARDSELTTHENDTSTHGVGEVVGRTEVQTLTNKTLTAPVIADFTNAQHDHQDADDGGIIDPAMPNLVLNSDFGRRTVFGLAMPEAFADTAGWTVVAGSLGSVASNVLTAGSTGAWEARAGLPTWRDGRFSAQTQIVETGANDQYRVMKYVDGSNWVAAELDVGGTVQVKKAISGVVTVVATVACSAPTLNDKFWLELEAQGTTYTATVYRSGVNFTTKADAIALGVWGRASGTVADAAVAAGYIGIGVSSSVATASKWGGIAASPGGVYFETWLPESWTVAFTGTLGGQAIGLDESADAGPLGRQWAMRAYIPAASRVISVNQYAGGGGSATTMSNLIPSVAYTSSIYEKISGRGGSGSLFFVDFFSYDVGITTPVNIGAMSDANEATWTRKSATATTAASARLSRVLVTINAASTATGTAFFSLPQLEQGSAATAWRNAPADDAPFGWFLEKDATSTTTSATLVDVDPRDYGINFFLPADATVDIEFNGVLQNTTANIMGMRFVVDGTNQKEIAFANSDAGGYAAITHRIRVRLAAGKHRVLLQYSVAGGGTASLFGNTSGYRSGLTVTAMRGK